MTSLTGICLWNWVGEESREKYRWGDNYLSPAPESRCDTCNGSGVYIKDGATMFCGDYLRVKTLTKQMVSDLQVNERGAGI